MRLLTHNGLTSPLPPHSTPLKILPTTLSLSPPTRSPNSPDDSTFVRSLLQKSRVDYFAVVKALEDIRPCLSQISCEHLSLPPELPEGEVGEEVVGSLVTLLLQIRVMEGELLDEVGSGPEDKAEECSDC